MEQPKIIKTIYHKIKINPFSYLLLIIISLTGLYKETLIIFSIIIIHELGHFIVAYLFKWNIKKIEIYPFGGCVSFDEKINRPIKEEMLILIFGPIIQIIYFILITYLFNENYISFKDYQIFKTYHESLLSFNLLPIYPLDGGRLVNLIFNYNFPFKKSNLITIITSSIIIILISINKNILSFYLITIILLIELFMFYKNQDQIYNRFLLERYLYKYCFKKFKVIKNKNSFYKEKRNIIKENNLYLTEEEFLKKRFRK